MIIKVFLPLSLAFIMFSLGLSLTLADFKRVAIEPKAFALGAFNQVIAGPLVAVGIALGFGLSRPEHVREACTHADAAVVGSALVQAIADASARGDDPAAEAGRFVAWLKTPA